VNAKSPRCREGEAGRIKIRLHESPLDRGSIVVIEGEVVCPSRHLHNSTVDNDARGNRLKRVTRGGKYDLYQAGGKIREYPLGRSDSGSLAVIVKEGGRISIVRGGVLVNGRLRCWRTGARGRPFSICPLISRATPVELARRRSVGLRCLKEPTPAVRNSCTPAGKARIDVATTREDGGGEKMCEPKPRSMLALVVIKRSIVKLPRGEGE